MSYLAKTRLEGALSRRRCREQSNSQPVLVSASLHVCAVKFLLTAQLARDVLADIDVTVWLVVLSKALSEAVDEAALVNVAGAFVDVLAMPLHLVVDPFPIVCAGGLNERGKVES